ncbi:pyruvate formate lyase 1-activating protein [Vibrio fluvialis]|uniref:pyruvate formate lyase 1-activating protein n=1 Tax=Vibrio fluvialis TaxID=676 RepID=UPI001C9D0ED3|nr:pyruvate formate lyase 1-activating protein [Vibrio fluvialis]ELD1797502.1 pyruvate formate lyase 1-activating protein [Vibrio fluvialis]MBY7935021.1 pyruvate formate lyase 1-activating protein [Vibrio fluvialis]MBY8158308.1 pyruvate formate lyase 1-activating protein [Vibrio fluvialis]MCE7581398.1 pyruvate formate lyase 1-activating protein [Vibrio fluvialis]MCG6370004.1 pyruvate formate lyase 1-activating protein [Vibrio fluvialis]
MSTIGRIHSFESCGTVDGPGIRFIVFLQGCLFRCKYCHNRDTWDTHIGKEVSVDEIIAEAKSYRHFMNASGGGVTCSGGESMLQPEFVRDFFRAAQAEGIHTCLDTNGYIRKYTPVIDEVLEATDLVMLDIKQMQDEIHQDLIGVSNKRTLDFARYLKKLGKKTWIRYVVVPGYTDDDESAHLLGQFIQDMDNVEKIELLPYHKLGAHKWEAMGEEYPLEGVNPPSKETMDKIVSILEQYHSNVKY